MEFTKANTEDELKQQIAEYDDFCFDEMVRLLQNVYGKENVGVYENQKSTRVASGKNRFKGVMLVNDKNTIDK